MTHPNQKGFALVEGLVILVIVALIAGAGYYVWHTREAAKSTSPEAQSPQKALKLPAGWRLLSDDTVTYKIAGERDQVLQANFTIPSVLKGKVAYQASIPSFAPSSYVADPDCNQAYWDDGGHSYDGPELVIRPYLADSMFDLRKDSSDKRTMAEYYAAHKSSQGDFYVDPFTSLNVYKVGQFFVSYEYMQAERYVTTKDVVYGKATQGPVNACYTKYQANFAQDEAIFTDIAKSVK